MDEQVILFVCSTTGQGDEPENMRRFWKFLLRRNLPEQLLSHIHYAVFGLGDSGYEKFNFAAKKLDRRLEQLSAQRVSERGEGDDQHELGFCAALEPWLEHVWKQLDVLFPRPAMKLPSNTLFPPKHAVKLLHTQLSNTLKIEPYETADGSGLLPNRAKPSLNGSSEYLDAVVKHNIRMTPQDHFQDIRHLDFHLPFQVESHYRPGDVLVVRPRNDPSRVRQLLQTLGWLEVADEVITIDPPHPSLPASTTLRQLFTEYLDAFSAPRSHSSLFHYISHFTLSQLKREKCIEYITPPRSTSATGANVSNGLSTSQAEILDEVNSYLYRPKRTLEEVLIDFEVMRMPIEYILDVFPLMREREFSICTALPLAQSQLLLDSTDHHHGIDSSTAASGVVEVGICMGVISYWTRMKTERRGVGTHFLRSLLPNDRVAIRLKRGTFRLPSSPSVPVIFIGPGLGIAPLRSMLLERVHNQGANENYVFFGCRFPDKDALYVPEFKVLSEQGRLKYWVAYSRQNPNNKYYVQDSLWDQRDLVFKLVHERAAYIYLSGNSKRMPEDVMAVLTKIIKTGLNTSIDAEANHYVQNLISRGRFQQETWS